MILKNGKKEIFVYEWPVESPKAIVQIVHGMAEHAGRYDAFARFLNGHGYYVVADDHRGHGKTDEKSLGYAPKDMFEHTLLDEALVLETFQKKYADTPVIVLGFSYGSFLTQHFIARHGEQLAAAIVAGSSYKKDAEVYLGSVVAALGSFFCGEKKPAKLIEKLSFGAYAKGFAGGAWLSTDDENNKAYESDPFCGFTCSFRFYSDFFRGLRGLYTPAYTAKLRRDLPVLLISGTDDPVGARGKGVKKLYDFYTKQAGMKNVKLKLFENSRHEFLNEKDGRAEKWGAVLAFLEETAGVPSEETAAGPVAVEEPAAESSGSCD